jgi:hypothetical protein
MPNFQKFAENVSILDGPAVGAIGVPLPTRMIVVKLADGSLWVIKQAHKLRGPAPRSA